MHSRFSYMQEANLLVSMVLDGDAISVSGIYTHEQKDIRLYGLLCFIGNQAIEFVLWLCPVRTHVTLYIETGNEVDF